METPGSGTGSDSRTDRRWRSVITRGKRVSLKYRSFALFWTTAPVSQRPKVASPRPVASAKAALLIPWRSRTLRTSVGARTPRWRHTASCRSCAPSWSINSRSQAVQRRTGRLSTRSVTAESPDPYVNASECRNESIDSLSQTGQTSSSLAAPAEDRPSLLDFMICCPLTCARSSGSFGRRLSRTPFAASRKAWASPTRAQSS